MIVRQVAQVLDLLEYFVRVKKPSKLAEISASLGWPRSSTFNLLTTLAQRGFLFEPRPRAGYYPSPKWIQLLHDIPESEVLPEQLCNAADDVAKETGETVLVAAPAGTNAIYLHVVESSAGLRLSTSVGYLAPIHATAIGRALLAQYSSSERASLLKKVKYHKYHPRSPMSAEQVEAELKRAVARGWHENFIHSWHEIDALGEQESPSNYLPDQVAVALPVGFHGRRLSIGVGGPASRMRRHIPQIAAILKRALKRHLPTLRATDSGK
jgi:IclR family transcriptional regulator, acetate operon repressor